MLESSSDHLKDWSTELSKQAGPLCVKPASKERTSPVLGCTFPELVKTDVELALACCCGIALQFPKPKVESLMVLNTSSD